MRIGTGDFIGRLRSHTHTHMHTRPRCSLRRSWRSSFRSPAVSRPSSRTTPAHTLRATYSRTSPRATIAHIHTRTPGDKHFRSPHLRRGRHPRHARAHLPGSIVNASFIRVTLSFSDGAAEFANGRVNTSVCRPSRAYPRHVCRGAPGIRARRGAQSPSRRERGSQSSSV